MGYGTPDKPARIRGASSIMTISTAGWTADASGVATRAQVATTTDVPVGLKMIGPAEALRLGHMVDETVWRVRCPIRSAGGTNIRISHDQYATIDSIEYQFLGPGNPQGSSGYQHAICKKAAK